MSTLRAAIGFALVAASAAGCVIGGDEPWDDNPGGDADVDTDIDTDIDGDVDTDVDSDVDGDSDTSSEDDLEDSGTEVWGDGGLDGGVDGGTEGLVVTDRVELSTSLGDFTIALYGDDVPITVANFLSYVDAGFYDGLVFHRVIADFVIQGGGYDEELTAQPTSAPIELELFDGLSHLPGVVGMARASDPDSATSQFFINVADNSYLDDGYGGYARFGVTESGYDVVEAISLVATETVGLLEDVPVEPVIIYSAIRI